MVIYGSLARRQTVHAELATCPRCGSESLHEVERRYRVVVLWLPLFVYDARLIGQCGHCLTEYPVVRIDAPLPKAPLAHRFGWVVLSLLLLLPLSLAGWAMMTRSAPEPEAAPLPVGERVLAKLEQDLDAGEARGFDPRCAELAAKARAALMKAADFESDALAVACARLRPRSGRPRVVLVARVPALAVDRARLADTAHAVNRSLEGLVDEDQDIVWAVADAGAYLAIARGRPRAAWRLQTDPLHVRALLVEALTY